MEDFGTVLTDAHLVVAAVFAVLLILAAIRLYRSRPRNLALRSEFSSGSRALALLRFAAVLTAGAGIFFALTVLLPLAPITVAGARVLAFAMLALWLVLEGWLSLTIPEERPARFKKLRVIGAIVWPLILVGAGGFFLLQAPAILGYATSRPAIMMALPFEGRWIASHAGDVQAINQHVRFPEQIYAVDMVAMGPDNRIRLGETDGQEDLYTFGYPVISPVDGIVRHAEDGHEDGVIPKRYEDIAGNHVFIEFAPQRYVVLAHFRKGTLQVREGQEVRAGDLLAEAGNSGNSDVPHLHVHVQDQPRLVRGATPYPWSFGDFKLSRMMLTGKVSHSTIIRNDIMESLQR